MSPLEALGITAAQSNRTQEDLLFCSIRPFNYVHDKYKLFYLKMCGETDALARGK
jgi:hypothetical protein